MKAKKKILDTWNSISRGYSLDTDWCILKEGKNSQPKRRQKTKATKKERVMDFVYTS